MDEFIERNLQLARGEDPDAKVLKIKDAEDLLYETPAELQPPTSLVRESEVSGVADIKKVELSVNLINAEEYRADRDGPGRSSGQGRHKE